MKALTLYWFSGTGNTWLAAQALAEALRGGGVTVALRRLEAAPPVSLEPEVALGVAFPVACFSTYPLVWRFLERLPPGEGRGAVLLATMGGASGGMAGPVGRFLRARGYRTLGARVFQMPGNYANRTIPAAKNAALTDRMRADVAAFAAELREGRASWTNGYPLWTNLLTRMARSPLPWRMFRKAFPLAVDRARCTRCGLCAALCPARCIRLEEGFPVWDANCQSCQRCIGYCPAMAIHVPGKPAEPYAAAPLEALRGE